MNKFDNIREVIAYIHCKAWVIPDMFVKKFQYLTDIHAHRTRNIFVFVHVHGCYADISETRHVLEESYLSLNDFLRFLFRDFHSRPLLNPKYQDRASLDRR